MIILKPTDPSLHTPDVLGWCEDVATIINAKLQQDTEQLVAFGVSEIHNPKT